MTLNPFGFGYMRKHWSLIPLVGCCFSATMLTATYIAYMCTRKGDFSFRPWSWAETNAPYQVIKPEEVRKIIQFHKSYHAIPEVDALRNEINQAYRPKQA